MARQFPQFSECAQFVLTQPSSRLFSVDGRSCCQARCQVIPATFHKAQESAGQLANPIHLAKPYRFRGNQFTAYAECQSPSEDKLGRILLVYAAGGDQWNVRVHSTKRPNVGFTANLGARNDLDEIRIRPPCGDILRGGQRSRNYDHTLACRELDYFWVKSVTRQELGSRIEALKSGCRVRHPARSYDDPGNALYKMRNDGGCLGHGYRDFDDWNPTAGK